MKLSNTTYLCATAALMISGIARATVVQLDTNSSGSTDGSIIYTSGGQTNVASSSYSSSYSSSTGRIVGVGGSTGARTVSDFVMAFHLPSMPSGNAISSATLTVYLQDTNGTTPAFNADLWGLGVRPDNAASAIQLGTVVGGASTATGDFNDADGDGNPTSTASGVAVQFSDSTDSGSGTRTKLADNMLTQSTLLSTVAAPHAVTVNIGSYLQSLYDAGANSSQMVMLRLSPDANITISTGGNIRYDLWTNNDANGLAPLLNIDFEPTPEPAALGVIAVGGMLAMRRKRRQIVR